MQAVAAELAGYAGKFRCFLESQGACKTLYLRACVDELVSKSTQSGLLALLFPVGVKT
jgi:hypothetical protein